MRRHGWRVVPSVSLAEPSAYREYIRASRGEFTVAKDQTTSVCAVAGFSDRSACLSRRWSSGGHAGYGIRQRYSHWGRSSSLFRTEDEALGGHRYGGARL